MTFPCIFGDVESTPVDDVLVEEGLLCRRSFGYNLSSFRSSENTSFLIGHDG